MFFSKALHEPNCFAAVSCCTTPSIPWFVGESPEAPASGRAARQGTKPGRGTGGPAQLPERPRGRQGARGRGSRPPKRRAAAAVVLSDVAGIATAEHPPRINSYASRHGCSCIIQTRQG
jgi:hypothetical protein